MGKIRVGVLGATGTVGQRFVSLLENHPYFELTELAASASSAGKPYKEAVGDRWKLETPIPSEYASLTVKECTPTLECSLVFSALDASVAGEVEEQFAKAGYIVSSNARNHRMEDDVPLLIPEVNADHLDILKKQRDKRGWKGCIVTNPNCSTIGLVLGLAPLHKKYGITKLMVHTMQAISGAGYPGLSGLDMLDNVIPYIGGEEEKIQTETLKLLSNLKDDTFYAPEIAISAHCNRVHVTDGHLKTLSVGFQNPPKDVSELEACLNEFNPLAQLDLPSAPKHPIRVMQQLNRPQPRFDRDYERGMAVCVGRVRECAILDYKMVLLSHNTVRGAAGAALLNAELMYQQGLLQ